jgi:hypothetical protein
MVNATGRWVHPAGGQSITALSSAKTEISLGEYYTTESSHHNCYTNGANETPITCPWCQGTTGTIDHMFFDFPSVTAFWSRLAKILHELLGPHPLQKKLILY